MVIKCAASVDTEVDMTDWVSDFVRDWSLPRQTDFRSRERTTRSFAVVASSHGALSSDEIRSV